MLQTLYIENIAVIEKSSIDFSGGLNVLTGETGAGKSIIIDAINAIMGQRTSREIVRTGASSAFVSAQFDEVNSAVRQKLAELGFGGDESELLLQRTLSASGKSTCKINGRPATAAMLREVAAGLINIHGQHESYELFSPETHIDYIDRYGRLLPALEDYKEKYKKYIILQKKLNEANSDESSRLSEIDLLSFQSKELFDADIQPGEEEALDTERSSLMNFEKLSSLLNRAHMLLSGEDNSGCELVDMAANAMQSAANYSSDYEEISNTLTDVYYNLRDCAESVSDALDSLESDPERLEEIEERLDLINRLTRKYNCTADELPALAEEMQTRLEELLNYDRNRDELIAACSAAKEEAEQSARALSDKRRRTAAEFAEKVKAEMSFLNMPNVELVPFFEESALSPKGIDKMELLISANPGETPRPVAKIASGGELSRMMLAIKTVLAGTDTVDTLIFDEVDTGISGSAAEKVGLKLREVSSESQVLCVTHQAQIAALADHHYLIKKQVEQGRTFTEVQPLDHEGRVNELARIIGGVNITEAARSHAEDMLHIHDH
ncbi:DNA repair protein RecN [Ruminococcus sp.]|uniref:DNA repair protein RecN n=1 Tax=Ruminococcus sp. TaxID=41978 RepID=UPI002E78319B|nr:DNA repair protein RecN [Ruminococcus sp.]MEE1263624.1 DNA repair protein RecN [Ruminococcus sp.]